MFILIPFGVKNLMCVERASRRSPPAYPRAEHLRVGGWPAQHGLARPMPFIYRNVRIEPRVRCVRRNSLFNRGSLPVKSIMESVQLDESALQILKASHAFILLQGGEVNRTLAKVVSLRRASLSTSIRLRSVTDKSGNTLYFAPADLRRKLSQLVSPFASAQSRRTSAGAQGQPTDAPA